MAIDLLYGVAEIAVLLQDGAGYSSIDILVGLHGRRWHHGELSQPR